MRRAFVPLAVLGMVVSLAFGPAAAAPEVVQIDPASQSIPENVLRMHVRFSEPMREGYFSDHIELVDLETGAVIPRAFYDSFYELWSKDHRRLTLLVDPGRVKTELQAHDEMGRAFANGRRYELRVLPQWKTMSGEELAQPFAWQFMVEPEIRTAMSPDAWQIEAAAGQVTIAFDRVVDLHSLNAHMRVLDASVAPIMEEWTLDPSGRVATVRFDPQRIPTQIALRHRFEDVAGNTVAAAFDHVKGSVSADQERAVSYISLSVE